MKRDLGILYLAIIAALAASCGDKGGDASSANDSSGPPIVVEAVGSVKKSEHFQTVSDHLDLGGVFYGYVDVAGDLDQLLETGQKVFDEVRRIEGEDSIPEVDIKSVASELGLQNIAALGGSSLLVEEDIYKNQAYLHVPGGRQGLLKIAGGEPHEFLALELAPEAVDIAFEQDFSLAALGEVAQAVLEKIPQPQQGGPPLDQLMSQEIPMLGITIADALNQSNGRVVFLADILDNETFQVPNAPIELPAIDFLLVLEGMGWLAEKGLGFLPPEGPFQLEESEDTVKLTMQLPPQAGLGIYMPTLLHDKKSDRVMLASRPEFLQKCQGETPRLASSAVYQEIMRDLPKQGNGMAYLSHDVNPIITKTINELVENAGGPTGIVEKVVEIVANQTKALGTVTINKPSGIHTIGYGSQSYKSALASAAGANPLFLGAMLMGARQQQTRAIAMRERAMADQAAVAAEAQVDERPADNLQTAVAALRQFATANQGKFPEKLSDLTPDYLSEDEAAEVLKWPNAEGGVPSSLVYFANLAIDSANNPVILASPSAVGGRRAVAYVDGTTGQVTETEFLQLARVAIEAGSGN